MIYSFNAGIDIRRQNLSSKYGPRAEHLTEIQELVKKHFQEDERTKWKFGLYSLFHGGGQAGTEVILGKHLEEVLISIHQLGDLCFQSGAVGLHGAEEVGFASVPLFHVVLSDRGSTVTLWCVPGHNNIILVDLLHP